MNLRILKYDEKRVLQMWQPDYEYAPAVSSDQIKYRDCGRKALKTGEWIDVPVIDGIPKDGNL
jgi:hypothetical protein